MNVRTIIIIVITTILPFPSVTDAREPTWEGFVLARGQQRSRIQARPIVKRPYRPLHVYGNTVRRRHYRGTAIPLPRDFYEGLNAFLVRE